MPNVQQSGLGQVLGDPLVVNKPLYQSGKTWYVHNVTGVDAASPRGLSPEYPLATIAQAVTNASDDDVICLMSGHTQTITGLQTISKKLAILGGGLSGGLPTVKFTNQTETAMFNITTPNVIIANIWFVCGSAGTLAPVYVDTTDFLIRGCYFECNNLVGGVEFSTLQSRERVQNCLFVSTSTSTVPRFAIKFQTMTDMEISGCTFDGGTVGWDGSGVQPGAAIYESAGSCTRFRGEDISLLRGSDIYLGSSTTGYLNVPVSSGGSRVIW